MANVIYSSFVRDIATGAVDVDTDTFYGMLVTSSYVADKDHDKRDDITNEVTAGVGYVAGGKAVTMSVTRDTANDRVDIAVADVSWTSATITNARAMVVYKRRGGLASADELVAYFDFGGDVSSTNGTFQVSGLSTYAIRISV